ncbi:MAG: hypothetical protein WCA37_10790 [Terracidiphilus sp.]
MRGTQTLVDQMGWVLKRPQLIAIEIGWRWAFGVPFLFVCSRQAREILRAIPLAETGFNSVDTQNPWVAAVQMVGVWAHYKPSVVELLAWLVPLAALAWIAISACGRALLLSRLERGLRVRPFAWMILQLVWFGLFGITVWAWFRSIQWAAASHITPTGDPDLIGYSIWAIFLSLGFFSLWALINWPVSIAPLLMVLEDRTPWDALGQSFRLGKTFTGKLMEINLVMGIVKLMIIVLAMVFSAAPLPFSDQLGSQALHRIMLGATIFYLVANDYFQVVRLKSFIEFWRTLRNPRPASLPDTERVS